MSQSRLPVVVREAEPEDAAALIDLWGKRVDGAAGERGAPDGSGEPDGLVSAAWEKPVVAEAAAAIAATGKAQDRRLLLALVEGDIVGALSVAMRQTSPIHLSRTMVVSDLHIVPRFRRKRVASTLMSAAVRWAEESGCEIVFTQAPAVSRDAHRFLTRLGFGHVATVRAAQVSALRSRFAGIATSSKDTGRLIAVRRTLRRRHAGARPLRPGA